MARLDPYHPDFQQQPPFQQLVLIMRALRDPETGCPWDLKQTHQTLTAYLVEEVFECIDALDALDMPQVCDELGDILLQVVFHAQLAEERGDFDCQAVCRSIVEKMVRRHPHMFLQGSPEMGSADQVLQQWDEIKKQEKGDRPPASALEGVSRGLPPFSQAVQLQRRARRTGFAFPDRESAWRKFEEELEEFRQDPGEVELGDMFFALISLAHQYGLDPEAALRSTNRKFRARFEALEGKFPEGFREKTPAQLVQAWKEISPAAGET